MGGGLWAHNSSCRIITAACSTCSIVSRMLSGYIQNIITLVSLRGWMFYFRWRRFARVSQDNRSVHLVSQEGESFDIKVSVAKMSNLVKTMIDGEPVRPRAHVSV